MPPAFYILFGAALASVAALALGKLLLRGLGLRLYRGEEHFFSFVAGSACLSTLIFGLAAVGAARKGVFLAAGAAILIVGWRKGVHRPAGDPLPPLPRLWQILFGLVFGWFTVLYFFNAMAPEISPDGTTYHLGLIGRYYREHGFPRITTHMYANLSQGVELLFLFAWAFGRHSAAALVHFAFLLALPLGMLCFAKRFGFPAAGAAASLFLFVSPVVGIDGISAYNDVAVAAVLFALFYLLQVWDEQRDHRLLIPIGLLAGFGYAAKYTAFVGVPYALGFLGWKLLRARKPLVRPLVVVSLCAAAMMLPWIAKNWIWLGNPFSPFFNKLFPNPYVHVSFEQEYAHHMRNYDGLQSHWDIPLEVTVRGQVLCGLLGPLFLLAPLSLLALRHPSGRRLLLAGLVFGLPYAANIGTRFLIPPLPYIALAMGLAFARWKAVAPALILLHAVLSWPDVLKTYCARYAWRLENAPVREALRLRSEEEFLREKWPGYSIARMIETHVPPEGKVLTFTQAAEAYTSREILVVYQAASNAVLGDILWTPLIVDYQPIRRLHFPFPAETLRKVRLVQTETGGPDHWSVTEARLFHAGAELARSPQWRLRAWPKPTDVQLAFDNSPVTRWRSWQSLVPDMFLEIDPGRGVTLDSVVLECANDQHRIRLRLEGMDASGQWKVLSEAPQETESPPPLGLRRQATRELRQRTVTHLLVYDHDFGAADFRNKTDSWGITLVDEQYGCALYRIDEP